MLWHYQEIHKLSKLPTIGVLPHLPCELPKIKDEKDETEEEGVDTCLENVSAPQLTPIFALGLTEFGDIGLEEAVVLLTTPAQPTLQVSSTVSASVGVFFIFCCAFTSTSIKQVSATLGLVLPCSGVAETLIVSEPTTINSLFDVVLRFFLVCL